MNSCYFKNIAFFIILSTILIVNLLRFFDLENVPRGFFLDEIASAVTAHCIATQGTDYSGRKWPLFGFLGFGSFLPPTQMYPLSLWTKIFGISIGSIRAFSAFVYTLGLLGIFLLARLIGGPVCAWATLLVSSLSPWVWTYSRMGIETILAPVFLIWGVFCFLRNARWWNMALAAFCMACAMYSYTPTRLQAPLVILLIIGYQIKQKQIQPKSLGLFGMLFILLSAPLVWTTLHGGLFVQRLTGLSITSKTSSWTGLILMFTKNFFLHFSPDFLFLTGDHNIRCSTRHFGALSWVDMLGLTAGLVLFILLCKNRKTPSHLVIFLLLAAAAGITPSALTWANIPNTVRSIGAQPFIELLIGLSIAKAFARWPQILIATSLTGVLFAASFLSVYFKTYPAESAQDFMSTIRVDAEHCQTENDWVKFFLHYGNDRMMFRYYIMRNYQKPWSAWFF